MEQSEPPSLPQRENLPLQEGCENSRQELRTWFRANAPHLGALYEGTLKILYTVGFPRKERFVAHAVREIRNRLPDAVAGPKAGGTVQYVNKLDAIVEKWRDVGLDFGGVTVSVAEGAKETPGTVSLPKDVYFDIVSLLKEHREARNKPEEAATRLFEAIAPENRDLRTSMRPVIHQWLSVTGWFVKLTHETVSGENIDEKELINKFETFEMILKNLVGSFFKTVDGLDEILENTNA